jgi:16S rRNA (guanine527-N7)-methyltransferase
VTSPLDALASGGSSILGRPLTGHELESFDKYLKLLQKWQKSQRLVGSSDAAWIVEKLFLDSLLFLRVLPREFASLADVGSGAGLPGIPLKIVRPHVRVALIESRARRASFLSAVIRELELRDTQVVTARVEDYARERPTAFDVVVMRCAGDFAELASASAGIVGSGGVIVGSGPPRRQPLERGEWVEVPGLVRGETRRFAVYREAGRAIL